MRKGLMKEISLILLVAIPQLGLLSYSPLLSLLTSYFRIGNEHIHLVLSIYLLALGLSVLIFSLLSKYFSLFKLQVFGVFLFCISTMLIPFVNTFYQFITLRFFQALGIGSAIVLTRIITNETYIERDKIRMISLLSITTSITPIISPFIGFTLYNTLGSYGIPLLLFTFSLTSLIFFYHSFFLSLSINNEEKDITYKKLKSNLPFFKKFFISCLAVTVSSITYLILLGNGANVLSALQHIRVQNYVYILSFSLFLYMCGVFFSRKITNCISFVLISRYSSFTAITIIVLGFVLPDYLHTLKVLFFYLLFSLMFFISGVLVCASQIELLKVNRQSLFWASGVFFFCQMAGSALYVFSTGEYVSNGFNYFLIIILIPYIFLIIVSTFIKG